MPTPVENIPSPSVTHHEAPQLTERHDDIARVAWASGIVWAFGSALLVIAWLKWRFSLDLALSLGAIVLLLGFLPFLMLAAQLLYSVHLRYQLAHVRVQAETARLLADIDLAQIDVNQDGKVDAGELELFLRYLNKLYFGGSPTAEFAARMGIGTEQWRRFGDTLVRAAIAEPVKKRGGMGFALREDIKALSWPQIESIVQTAARKESLFATSL